MQRLQHCKTYQSTGGANDKSFTVPMYQLLKRIVGVRTVDNSPVGFLVVGCLSPKFATKELVDLSRRSMQTQGDVGDIWNRGFDTISGPFDFTKDGRHFVAILRIVYRGSPGDVDDLSSTNRHDGKLCCFVFVVVIDSRYYKKQCILLFFLAEGIANGFLKDEMILQGSDGTIASVNSAGGLNLDYSF